MKILRLEAENVKRLRVVEITPEGDVVVIGGDNANGKTSVLDAICMALGGAGEIPKEPVRRGEKKARVTVDLGDIKVTRMMNSNGSTSLTVTNKEGAVYKSPQALLDGLIGRISFDPLAFTRLDPKQQKQQLLSVLGLDFSKIDAKRQQLYEDRTLVNRESKAARATLETLPQYPEAPKEEVSISSLTAEVTAIADHNRANEKQREALGNMVATGKILSEKVAGWNEQISDIDRQIQVLQTKKEQCQACLKKATEDVQRAREDYTLAKAKVDALEDKSDELVQAQLLSAEADNRKVRANRQRETIELQAKAKEEEADKLSKEIEALDQQKSKMLTDAKFPVAGLSFGADSLFLDGIPFEQASAAQQLRVSCALAMSADPKLRVMLVRDGSLLDQKSLALLGEIVRENDFQCWLESCNPNHAPQVVLVDGSVEE